MNKIPNANIRAHGFALSGASVFYLSFIYIGAMWGLLIVMIPLGQFFPVLLENEWFVAAPPILVVMILLIHILCCFHSVDLTPNMVIIKWFGVPVRRIPVSRLKMFCAVGNEREDVLCLSCHPVDEMAHMQEKRLLRSFLYKHNVPFRKRRPDWQDTFAREYLNYLRRSPFGMFWEQNVVMLEMHPALQYAILQMYPQLSYKNYTGVTSQHASRFSGIVENRAVCFPSQLYEYEARMELDGIHISAKKKDVLFIPAQQIKTVVRVDIFKGYEKYYPHHMPLLFVTCMSGEELAAQAAGKGYFGIHLGDTANQATLEMMAATYLTLHWSKNNTDCCVVHLTENNLNTLRTLYPHVCINEISATWLHNSIARPAVK